MLFTRKKLSSGRSMLEMIGVIAIIGLIGAGSLLAYQQAMVSKKANDIVTYMSNLSLVVSRKRQFFENEDCASFNNISLTVPQYFSSCKVSYSKYSGMGVWVTFNGDATDVMDALEGRRMSYMCSYSMGGNDALFIVGGTFKCDRDVPIIR